MDMAIQATFIIGKMKLKICQMMTRNSEYVSTDMRYSDAFYDIGNEVSYIIKNVEEL